MSEWQPIETAPRDNTDVLLFFPLHGEYAVGRYLKFPDEKRGRWTPSEPVEVDGYGHDPVAFLNCGEPSDWMPLPEPPEADS